MLLLISCKSDPLLINPPGGYQFEKNVFTLNTELSKTIQGEDHTGESPRLYAGILLNGDTVYTLVQILPQPLNGHPACSSLSVSMATISLNSTQSLSFANNGENNYLIQRDSIKVYLLPPSEVWDEQLILTEALIAERYSAINDAVKLPDSLLSISQTIVEITLPGNLDSLFKNYCSESLALTLLISYIPNMDLLESSQNTYIEFNSSNLSNSTVSPQLSVDYMQNQFSEYSQNRYDIKSVSSDPSDVEELYLDNAFYILDPTSPHWGTIYAINIQSEEYILTESVRFDSVIISGDLIDGAYNQSLSLLTINIEIDPASITDSDSVYFTIDNAVAFRSMIDPAGDNWNVDSAPDSTENNQKFDNGEFFEDYGIDGCKDFLEDGVAGCVEDPTNSPYNNLGTEGNSVLDWIDRNGNGVWDSGEGEEWHDWGSDFCPDSQESGDGLCNGNDGSLYDPNKDNADPIGDNWNKDLAPDNTENNGSWDSGEAFKDWGVDGLPASLSGDPDFGEGNDQYDFGEPFEDTGADGKYDQDEVEYYTERTEGNGKIDEGELLDCGEDTICDDNDTSDDYNVDPNQDNWNVTDSTGTEGDGILNWEDVDGNNYWGEGEGERWYDFGVDRVPDSLEAFQVARLITPYLPTSEYLLNLQDGGTTEFIFDIPLDSISVWISQISKLDENKYELLINIQTHKPLSGMQFRLHHNPFIQSDSLQKKFNSSIASVNGEKIFQDFTLNPRKEWDENNLGGNLRLEYADNLKPLLEFDSLYQFLHSGDYIFSHQHSNLVLYLDQLKTSIYPNGMLMYIGAQNSNGEDVNLAPYSIPFGVDSVSIPIGVVLKGIQNGTLSGNTPIYLLMDGTSYNYSTISFIMNSNNSIFNPRIELMYSQ